MSPTCNGGTVFECGNAIKIRNGIMFDFYPGLLHVHMYIVSKCQLCKHPCTVFSLACCSQKYSRTLVQYPAILPSHSSNLIYYVHVHIKVYQRNSTFELTSLRLTLTHPNHLNFNTRVPMQPKYTQS